ncbi:MAG: DUF87 domain-containing protein [Oscillospiraceae bacterium]|nr:DUF87 domain-containing protein [Oscillospiraceae bacterium]MBR1899398.1 DUF87 domain-containing protein [Oscillospiraceae bacterium]
MRLIPGRTKVRIELFRGVTIGDVIVAVLILGLAVLVLLSTFPGKIVIAGVLTCIGVILELRLDTQPIYMLTLGIIKHYAYPRHYRRTETVPMRPAGEDADAEVSPDLAEKIGKIKENQKAAKSGKGKKAGGKPIQELMAFTGIQGGFIEYNGKYFGTVIEISPVEFRFFSRYRRNMMIEDCLGKILRALRDDYAANIVKIERPIIYDAYLEQEYDKLDALRASYENGFLTEEELKARVEIQYDRINAMQKLCGEDMVIQPFYYITLFNVNKSQLLMDTNSALAYLRQGDIPVRRIERSRDLAIFLKYTNMIDFDEKEIDRIDPKDYVAWASPESVDFTVRTAQINGIVSHQMRAVGYPAVVGDAWLASVMSIPSTKVVVKVTPMDRAKSIKVIDRSLQELRGQYRNTGVDSKRMELQTHIETLSELLATLHQENETLLTVNIYVTMYDSIRTTELGQDKVAEHTRLTPIGDMKKTVRRAWNENGIKLSSMDFEQLHCFIGSQVSAYDPMLRDGRGMPSNTVAGMFPWIYASVSDEGGIRLGSHEGVPVFINFFRRDSERINSNMVIIGKSGSGKSYGTKSILTNMASEDAKIFILDPENEYTELAHNLHGKVINVGNANYGRLNPFHVITSLDDDETGTESAGGSFSTHLQFLEEFFRQILPDTDREALEYLNTLVERLYADFNITMETDLSKLTPEDYPIFDDLYDLVLEEFQQTNNQYLRTMLHTLVNNIAKFSKGGRNANIWNGPSTITTEENFSVFNFQSLLANRNTTIANAQMLLVLKYVDNEIIKNRDYNRRYGLNRKVVVVIDEAHVFIDTKFPVALDFMFQLAKRIRKYNGMQIVITQNIKDFVGSEEIARKSTAIINACQYSFIFGLAPNDMDDLCKLYEKAGGINEIEQERIITAPRGMAFAIMSPTSRSSFMVEVPKPMVKMFEEPEYVSRYFSGEQGVENWEDFVSESREEHDLSIDKRRAAAPVAEETRPAAKKSSFFNLVEVSAEEADAIDSGAPTSAKTMSLSEYSLQPKEAEAAPESVPAQPAEAPAAPAPQPMQMDIQQFMNEVVAGLSRAVRESIPPAPAPAPAPVYREETPAYRMQDDEEQTAESAASTEAVLGNIFDLADDNEDAVGFGGYDEEEDTDGSVQYEDEEPLSDGLDDDEDFDPCFDIMNLLDEQLDNYMSMDLKDRMEKFHTDEIEVTFEDLTAFIKNNRKKRG